MCFGIINIDSNLKHSPKSHNNARKPNKGLESISMFCNIINLETIQSTNFHFITFRKLL